jgi:hypothetical protein
LDSPLTPPPNVPPKMAVKVDGSGVANNDFIDLTDD